MRGDTIRLLLVDDDSIDAELTSRALRSVASPDYIVEHAASLAEAQAKLERTRFDVALLDLGLPDSPRTETLQRLRASCPSDFPIVVLTGLDDEEGALQSLDLGAQDYLSKNDLAPDLLSRSIRYAMQRQHLLDELNRANDQLEQKNDRLAQLYNLAQEFVENVSHEFRTPLTVIREMTSIVHDGLDGPLTPRQAEHLETVIHRTDDLALMVDDMLDISKLEAGLLGVWRKQIRVEELIEIVLGFVKGRAESKQICLTTSIDDNLPPVYCDDEKARRVIINLAVNAIKFTPEGGAVEIWAHGGSENEPVTIGITDTGPGLSPENLAVIFERFRQIDQGLRASTKGFGLGLNIAKELVALNLGEINVDSKLGVGSTFSFTLPQLDPQSLLDRHLKRIATHDRDEVPISLFTASIDLADCPNAVPVMDEFLQRSVRANDLVVSYAPATWIIVAVCPESDSGRLVDRLANDWTSFVRNSPRMNLQNLTIEYDRTFDLLWQRDALDVQYLALTNASRHIVAKQKTVLVVDDDVEVSQCLATRLQAAGYNVLSEVDGEAGSSAAIAHIPDAIVLDVRMPKKDGLAVLRELRMHPSLSKTPIVMLSASIRDQHRALEAGASYFVPKPYEANQVLSALKNSLHQETLA